MAARAREQATYDDLVKVPEHLVAELIDGELFTSPRPRPRHSRASSRLGGILGNAFEYGANGPGGWIFYDEPELHIGRNVLVPDIAGWRIEHSQQDPDRVAMTVPPDWLCEVISPSTGRLDRSRKLPIYAQHGIGHAWLIDPSLRTLEVFRLENGRWSLIATHGDDDVVRAEPFADLELKLSLFWFDDSPPTS